MASEPHALAWQGSQGYIQAPDERPILVYTMEGWNARKLHYLSELSGDSTVDCRNTILMASEPRALAWQGSQGYIQAPDEQVNTRLCKGWAGTLESYVI